jgi:hypothetical protein
MKSQLNLGILELVPRAEILSITSWDALSSVLSGYLAPAAKFSERVDALQSETLRWYHEFRRKKKREMLNLMTNQFS